MGAPIDFTPSDFNAVVQTVAGEAANQPPEAQRAVASTVLNRHALLGGSLADIALDPSIYNGARTANAKAAAYGTPLYRSIADNITPVFTNGPTTTATHFHAGMDRLPHWDNGTGTKIGDQVFLDRSDLLKPRMPTADELEAHFARTKEDIAGSGISRAPSPGPVQQARLPNVPGYIDNPANLPGETGAIPIGGPTADEIEARAAPTADDLESYFGGPSGRPKIQTSQQKAAAIDAGQVEDVLAAVLSKLTNSDARFSSPKGGGDLASPFVHGISQLGSDELKGKMFAGVAGARNLIYDALGKPVPYGMADAEAAETEAARQHLETQRAAHPIATMAAELLGGAAPWIAGGEILAPAKAVATAPTALGRLAQIGGRIVTGGAKGSALGASSGALAGFNGADGTAVERAPHALAGAEIGGLFGGALGAAGPLVAPAVGKVASALGGEVGAASGALRQGATNALSGKPVEVTAKDYFAGKSPAAQKIRGSFAGADAAENVEPTADETRLAQSRVLQMMGAKGMHTDDLRTIPEDLPHTTAEAIGSQTVNHLASLARRAGTTPDMAGTQIAERTRNFGSSILDDFGKATGIQPEEAAGNIDAMVSRLRGDADPMFAAVRSHPGPVWSPDLAKISERPVVAKAIDAAGKDMLNAGKDPLAVGFKLDPDTGAYTLDSSSLAKTAENQPTAETWDAVRQRLGDQVDRNPLTGKVVPDSQSRGNYSINVAKRDLTNILAGDKDGNGALIPGYRNALDASGEYLSVQSAFDRGSKSLLTDTVTPRVFEKTYSDLTPGEKQAWTAGIASKLYDQSQTGRGLTPALVKSPAFQAKIRTVMGDQADDFLDRLTQRTRLHMTGARIMPGSGSQTQPLLQAGSETAPIINAFGDVVKEGAHALKSPGTFLLKHAINARLGDKAANVVETPGYRNAYGRLLLQHPRETADELRAAATSVKQKIVVPPRGHTGAVAGVAAGQLASH